MFYTKRAQYDLGRKAIYLILVLFVLTFIFFFTNRTFAQYNAKTIDKSEWTENLLIVSELINSPNCFVFFDEEINRAYPGIFDPAKLRQSNLGERCLVFAGKKVKVEIDGKIIGEEPQKSITIQRTVLLKTGEGLVPKMMEVKIETG